MSKIFMLEELTRSRDKLFVWAFIPYRITEQGLNSEFYDLPEFRQQLTDVFAELGIKWKWQPITFENMHAVVKKVSASSNNYIPVVLNYCDGTEIDGYPGVSVVKILESKGIIFTGANAQFFNLCDSKILMKRAFVEHDVATASYEVITDINHIQGVCDRLGTPLIVKPAISLESRGISSTGLTQLRYI
jgi:D-alanine-D-alanine ligase